MSEGAKSALLRTGPTVYSVDTGGTHRAPEIGLRLELFTAPQAEVLIRDAQEIGRMINGLVRSLERSEHQRSR